MSTLYIRDVREETHRRLTELARREKMSVSAFVARELDSLARRADNDALLDSLGDAPVGTDDILVAIDDGRSR